MKADYHVHTEYSNDSTFPFEESVQEAIKQGIDEICITEHSDYGYLGDVKRDDEYVVDFQKYYEGYLKYKAKYKDQISIKFGCEFGVQMHTIDLYKRDFNKYPFDFIILSNHQIDDLEYWTYEYQENRTQQEYNEGYYQATLDVIKNFNEYSVLGHLDVIKRYDKAGAYPDEKVDDIVVQIFEHLIKNNKGIEVNTSYERYGVGDTTPSRHFLELYHQMGGRIITIGSDSHERSHVGCLIDETKDLLKEIGFKEYCTFDKMKPIFHKL